MNVTIRLAKTDEIETIIDLQSLSISNLGYKEYNEQQLNAIIKSQKQVRLMQNDEIIYVAESSEGSILGFGAFIQTNLNTGEIAGIYIDPKYLGKGIGTQIIKKIEDKALQKGILQLNVNSSLNSINFYHRKGYKLAREKEDLKLVDETVIPCKVFSKQLRPLNLIEKMSLIIFIFLIIGITLLILIGLF